MAVIPTKRIESVDDDYLAAVKYARPGVRRVDALIEEPENR